MGLLEEGGYKGGATTFWPYQKGVPPLEKKPCRYRLVPG